MTPRVCRNLAEAQRDRLRRERALARLDDELAAIQRKQGDARLRAEGELLAHPTLARCYLTRRRGRLVVDQAGVRADARLDGKWLLSCTDDAVSAADLAVLYKQLIEVERSRRDLKHVLDLRPIYHRKQERIRAHVTLCFLALMLVRVAETTTGDTWPQIRRELDRIHLGEFVGPAGRLTQRTETTPRQRELLRTLQIREPPLVYDLAIPSSGRRRVPRACRHYTPSGLLPSCLLIGQFHAAVHLQLTTPSVAAGRVELVSGHRRSRPAPGPARVLGGAVRCGWRRRPGGARRGAGGRPCGGGRVGRGG
jgi:hypothetical protein